MSETETETVTCLYPGCDAPPCHRPSTAVRRRATATTRTTTRPARSRRSRTQRARAARGRAELSRAPGQLCGPRRVWIAGRERSSGTPRARASIARVASGSVTKLPQRIRRRRAALGPEHADVPQRRDRRPAHVEHDERPALELVADGVRDRQRHAAPGGDLRQRRGDVREGPRALRRDRLAREERPRLRRRVAARRAEQPRRAHERRGRDAVRARQRMARRRDDDERVAQERLGLDRPARRRVGGRAERDLDAAVREQPRELAAARDLQRDLDAGWRRVNASSSGSATSSATLAVAATRSVACAPPPSRTARHRLVGEREDLARGACEPAPAGRQVERRRRGARRGRRRARGARLRPRQISPARTRSSARAAALTEPSRATVRKDLSCERVN